MAAGAEQGARPARVVALLDGREVGRDDLWVVLAEAAGGQVTREMVLDARLASLAAERKVVIDDRAIRAERAALGEVLGGTGLDADGVERVIEAFRRERGLGPVRFEALLRRNAILRAMTNEGVTVTEEQVVAEYARATAPVARVLLYTAATTAEAGRARREIATRAHELAGGVEGAMRGALVAAFAERALLDSTDPTGAAGGVLPAFSLADVTIPGGIRRACEGMNEGEMSNVIGLGAGQDGAGGGGGGGGGGAIVVLLGREERTIGTLEGARPRLRAEIARRQQRGLMDALSRELLGRPGLVVMDASLAYGGQNRAPTAGEVPGASVPTVRDPEGR
jgi:hypothetical protein